ncbi:acyl carrier protein [Candidatus Profftella armatura]
MNFIQNSILNALSESLIIQIDIIKLNIPFSDYGIDSILGVNFIQKINNDLKLKLNTTILFDYTTVDSLSQYIITNYKEIIEKKYLTTISKEKLEKSIVNNQNNSLNKDNIHSSSLLTQNNSYKLKNNIQNKNFISEKNIDKSVLMNFIQNSILNALSESLIIQIDIIKLNIPFSDYGIDSILGVNFIQKINNDLKLKLNTTILFDYTTVDSLSQYIITNYKEIIEKNI